MESTNFLANPTNPDIYRNGVPLYWANEKSGRLKTAISNFWASTATPDDLALVAAYLRHWAHAPVWADPDNTLAAIRNLADNAVTVDDLEAVITALNAINIDPF